MEIKLLKGDITKIEVDAIVNAANASLLGGGGVDGAIHRAGGQQILEDCRKIRAKQGGCKVGEAVITTAGKLNAKYVIHTVGPRWNEGNSNEAEKLKNCYLNSLRIASENGVKTIAFPNISTGIFGYPLQEAAEIAVKTVSESDFTGIETVIFVCFNDENFNLYDKEIRSIKKRNKKMKIHLKIGIDNLKFGMSQSEVAEIIGEPNREIEDIEFENVLIWEYTDQKLRLSFYKDEDNRFGGIHSSNPSLEIDGYQIIDKKIEDVMSQIDTNPDSWEKEEYLSFTTYFHENYFLTLDVEYERVTNVEFGVTFKDENEYDWPE